ncbi:hypothetical protein ACFLU4_06180 [Chloroflexota bacterium]
MAPETHEVIKFYDIITDITITVAVQKLLVRNLGHDSSDGFGEICRR